ncbi:MAG: hypothetical protein QOG39_155 [Acidimicrobiaceae bacterium]
MKRAADALRVDVRAALPGWIAGRVLVAVAWLASSAWISWARDGVRPDAHLQGLFAWDGVFYRGIAEHGYGGEGTEALRFFPLFPLLGRALGAVIPGGPGLALLLVANGLALLAAALVHRLVRTEIDAPTARRAALLIGIAPPAFVLSWAYAESLLLVLAAATFLALRRERWWWAAVLGFLAGLCRPTGALLAVGALIEACRDLRRRRPGEIGARLAAVVGPVAGSGAYLWWAGREYGDWKLPLRVQDELRHGVTNPLVRIGEAFGDALRLDVHGLHLPFVLAMLALLVVAIRVLPLSFAAFAGAVVLIAVSAGNLNSVERYGLNAFPLLIALAVVAKPPWAERLAVAVCGAGLVALCTLAWLGEYVP